MSLLQPIRGTIPLQPTSAAAVAEATRRLCTELLAHNRLRPGDVVAARFVGDAGMAVPPLDAARAVGWTGIPIFFTRSPAASGRLEVEAHVRLVRRRRLKVLELS
ncbi:chorismate mutase [Vulgatibacter sp.]|uniref:chorismate mutase n=1 Tax=Vulgatibacter sp. TaxID=1971226 RepID=UPI00356B0AA9